MSFRRIPFQFTSTDPVERQAELEKRFGLPSRNMFVGYANPVAMGACNRDLNQSSSSPRLQHRVPIFVEGHDQPIKSSVDSIGSNLNAKKPNVRVIPIEIEGAGPLSSNRLRTFSGPAGWTNKEESVSPRDASPLKRSMQDLSHPPKMKVAAGPKIHNIPIQVETKSPTKPVKVSKPTSLKLNGCVTSKPTEVKSSKEVELKPKQESGIEVSLKKIKNVMEELKLYESGVKEFKGTVKDKQYRYLDEMLTRCMLRLDDIETMGNDEVRSARKSAIKKVQACIDLLETKVNVECESINDKVDTNLVSEVQDYLSLSKDVDMKESGDDRIVLESSDKNSGEITEVEMAESKDDSQCQVIDTKLSNKVTELYVAQLQGEVSDNQTEKEREENNSSVVAITSAGNKETEVELAVEGVSNEFINNEAADIEMMESKPVETESLNSSELLNETPALNMPQNVSNLNLSVDQVNAEPELSDDTKLDVEAADVEKMESKPVETESLNSSDVSNETSAYNLPKNNTSLFNLPEDQINADPGLYNDSNLNGSCSKSVNKVCGTYAVDSVPEVAINSGDLLDLSTNQTVKVSDNQINTEL